MENIVAIENSNECSRLYIVVDVELAPEMNLTIDEASNCITIEHTFKAQSLATKGLKN